MGSSDAKDGLASGKVMIQCCFFGTIICQTRCISLSLDIENRCRSGVVMEQLTGFRGQLRRSRRWRFDSKHFIKSIVFDTIRGFRRKTESMRRYLDDWSNQNCSCRAILVEEELKVPIVPLRKSSWQPQSTFMRIQFLHWGNFPSQCLSNKYRYWYSVPMWMLSKAGHWIRKHQESLFNSMVVTRIAIPWLFGLCILDIHVGILGADVSTTCSINKLAPK